MKNNKKVLPYIYINDSLFTIEGYEEQLEKSLHKYSIETDGVIIMDETTSKCNHEKYLDIVKDACDNYKTAVIAGGNIKDKSDALNLLDKGCQKVIFDVSKNSECNTIEEAFYTFGKDRIITLAPTADHVRFAKDLIERCSCELIIFYTADLAMAMAEVSTPIILRTGESISESKIHLIGEDRVVGLTGPFIDVAKVKESINKGSSKMDINNSLNAIFEEIKSKKKSEDLKDIIKTLVLKVTNIALSSINGNKEEIIHNIVDTFNSITLIMIEKEISFDEVKQEVLRRYMSNE